MAPSSGIAPSERPLRTPAPDPGEVVVTATVRLARELARANDARAIGEGRLSWVAPEILPFEGWLSRLWREWLYSDCGQPVTLLPPAAESVIWEQVIQASGESRELLDVERMVDSVRQAWTLLWHWELPDDGPEWADSEDTEAFRIWAAAFRNRLAESGWISSAMLPVFLRGRVDAGEVPLPRAVRVVGYDELPGAYERLLASLERAGVRVVVQEPAGEAASSTVRVSFGEASGEIRAAAAWARRCLEENGRDASVGVVVPDMGRRREAVERLFREAFDPGSHLDTSRDRRRGFNISLGRPLADYPVVECALQLLRLRPDRIPLERAPASLLSRFVHGAEEEQSARACLVRELTDRREAGVRASLIEQLASDACPLLAARLRAWRDLVGQFPESALPREWAQHSAAILAAFGWPGASGESSLDSATYQAQVAWQGLLNSLGELDSVLGLIPFSTAVSFLERRARSLLFQPESEPAPVQILGLFEAGGFRFDHVWVMGMDDLAWPRAREASPFLPASLQRELGLPGSSPEADLHYARRLTRRLLSGAKDTCVVSHARGDADTGPGPSPLFRELPEIPPAELVGEIPAEYADEIQRSSRIEVIADPGPPWRVGCEPVRGGTAVLSDQAACPFRAFARSRLGAVAREDPRPGLDARDRGWLVHEALDRVWSELGSHEALCAAYESDDGSLAGILRRAVDGAIGARARTRSILRSPGFREIERARLQRLLGEWLSLEKQRAPFRVLARETRVEIRIGPLTLLTRMDRIDQLADGTQVLIDYKTGPASPASWDGDRPEEPQLPVYASELAGGSHPLSGVCFGIVRAGQTRFAGVSAETGVLPGVGPGEVPLEERVAAWRVALRGLAEQFAEGRAEVDPRDGPATCRRCDLGPLCRIGERHRIRGPR